MVFTWSHQLPFGSSPHVDFKKKKKGDRSLSLLRRSRSLQRRNPIGSPLLSAGLACSRRLRDSCPPCSGEHNHTGLTGCSAADRRRGRHFRSVVDFDSAAVSHQLRPTGVGFFSPWGARSLYILFCVLVVDFGRSELVRSPDLFSVFRAVALRFSLGRSCGYCSAPSHEAADKFSASSSFLALPRVGFTRHATRRRARRR